MTLDEMRAYALGVLDRAANTAAAKGWPAPKVGANLDIIIRDLGRTTNGKCRWNMRTQHHTIELNRGVFAQAREAFHDTIIHEYAHAVAHALWYAGRVDRRNAVGHGPVWRSVARALGIEPTRCRSYAGVDYESLPGRNTRPIKAKCNGCGEVFGITTRAAAKLGRLYHCCGSANRSLSLLTS